NPFSFDLIISSGAWQNDWLIEMQKNKQRGRMVFMVIRFYIAKMRNFISLPNGSASNQEHSTSPLSARRGGRRKLLSQENLSKGGEASLMPGVRYLNYLLRF